MSKKLLSALFATICILNISAQECTTSCNDKKNDNCQEENKLSIGGYGEIVASFKDYDDSNDNNSKRSQNTLSIPSFILSLEYKFTPKWILGSEIEFKSEGSEVALEQFHVTRLIVPEFNVRAGHIILPLGLTNSTDEPIALFGANGLEGETTILPDPWHETGLELFGTLGSGYSTFSYQLMVIAGLNANGFDRDTWITGGIQGFSEEANFNTPGYLARLSYEGIPGLRLGTSFYFCEDAGNNSEEYQAYASYGKIPVRIYCVDAEYKNRYIIARANFIYGNLGNSAAVSKINTNFSDDPTDSGTMSVAKNAISYSAEIGVNISALFPEKKIPVIYPYIKYEYYNPQEKGEKGQTMEASNMVSMWQGGINWFALPNLAVKADYTTRQIGTDKIFGTSSKYNSKNEFSIGIAYTGLFTK